MAAPPDTERPAHAARRPERAARLAVGLVWLAGLLALFGFVARYASPIPLWDDLSLVPWTAGGRPLELAWLWEQHNEHRLPLAKLLLVALIRATGDVRAPMVLSILVLAATAAATVAAARRLRGRTSLVDVALPVVWLHLGHGKNLLMGFQLSLVLPAALTTAALVVALRRPGPPSGRTWAALALPLLLLPLNAGAGAMYATAWAGCLAALGVVALVRGERASARAALALGIALAALVAAYAAGLEQRAELRPHLARAGPWDQAATALHELTLAFGPAGRAASPWGEALLAVLVVATVVALVRVAWRRPDERWRAGALLAAIGGVVATAAAIGYARGRDPAGGFAERYVVLVAPLPTALVLAWTLALPERVARSAQLVLALLLWVALPTNVRAGLALGRQRRVVHERLVRDAERGLSTRQLAREHWRSAAPRTSNFAFHLGVLRDARWTPFEHAVGPDVPLPGARGTYPMFRTVPDDVVAPQRPRRRRFADGLALVVPAGTRIAYELGAEGRTLRGRYGTPPEVREGPAVEVVVTLEDGAARRVLLERRLAPGERPAEDGETFEVAVPAGAPGRRLVLATRAVGGVGAADGAWSWWSALELE